MCLVLALPINECGMKNQSMGYEDMEESEYGDMVESVYGDIEESDMGYG